MRWSGFRYIVLPVLVACSSGASQGKSDRAPDGVRPEPAEDTGEDASACVEGWEVGMCPPDFTLVDARDELQSLSALRGQPILVLGTAEW